jgi:hypothetical protein
VEPDDAQRLRVYLFFFFFFPFYFVVSLANERAYRLCFPFFIMIMAHIGPDRLSYTQFGERQFERLTQAFAERERAVARLSQKLHYLGEAIDRANEDCE